LRIRTWRRGESLVPALHYSGQLRFCNGLPDLRFYGVRSFGNCLRTALAVINAYAAIPGPFRRLERSRSAAGVVTSWAEGSGYAA
jgi:hypothetical protein